MASLLDLESPRFAGHESFPFRYGWLKKGVDAISGEDASLFFARPDALIPLGVGKNMVYSIRHWLVVLGLAEMYGKGRGRKSDLRPSDFATELLGDEGWDPYLEDEGTLWLLHHRLVMSRERAATWWWGFHRPPTATFRRSELVAELLAAAAAKGWRATAGTVKRDVDCFVRTYLPLARQRADSEDAVACPLTTLGLVQPTSEKDEYILSYGFQPSLPDAIFRWAVAEFCRDTNVSVGDAFSVSLERLLHDEGSPGRVFRLSEEAMLERLYRLGHHTHGDWEYDETSGLRQLRVRRLGDASRHLNDYYQLRRGESLGRLTLLKEAV